MIREFCQVLVHALLIEVRAIPWTVTALVPPSNDVLRVTRGARDTLVESLTWFWDTDLYQGAESKDQN